MKVFRVVGLLMLVLAVSTWPAVAQEGSWGVGVFANYNVPVFGLGDWYDNDSKFGLNAAYVPAPNVTVEMEFHHGNFTDGSLLTRTFTWIDGNDYTSPNAASNMSLNSLLLNALVRLRQIGQPFAASSFAPYIAVGGGFYRYRNDVSGLLWPLQTEAPPVGEMEPFTDQRFALGINAGLGVEAFVIDNVAVDLRARYNMMFGDLRPLEDWELSGTFPLQMLDFGAGIKFYFSGK